MTFDEALSAISSLHQRKWRNGLDRMQAFVNACGLDDLLTSLNYVHVAGTNGKGSTTAYLQSIFVEAGKNTGAFFSPYVVDPRERVQIGRNLIAKEKFALLTERLMAVDRDFVFDGEQGVSEFEFKTALGFAAWQDAGCDWVALEVGLGGRIDATNVVSPRCSVIVSIGLDHTSILGPTIEEIAGEKAGIVKSGIPVLVGEMPEPAFAVIEAKANAVGAPAFRFGHEIRLTDGFVEFGRYRWRVAPGILGVRQPHNAALAAVAAHIAGIGDLEAIERGIARASIPGRDQVLRWCGKTVIIDGAHNMDSAGALAATLRQEGIVKASFVVGMLTGHDPNEFVEPLRELASEIICVPIDFLRAFSPDALALQLGATSADSILDGLEQASEDVIVVTGSLYLAGEAIRLLS